MIYTGGCVNLNLETTQANLNVVLGAHSLVYISKKAKGFIPMAFLFYK